MHLHYEDCRDMNHAAATYTYDPSGLLASGTSTVPVSPPSTTCPPPVHLPTPPAACPPALQHSPVGPPPCLTRSIAANHFLYDGQYLDSISGLYYLCARWYDPATGQFTSIDALVALTSQPYSYAGGDPINGGDPNGTCTRWNWSCYWDNFKWWLKIEASSSGKVAVNENQAENFLISNGVASNKKEAADFVNSFNWSKGNKVYMTLTTNISENMYRYYGGHSSARGLYYTTFSGYGESQCSIRSALALQNTGNSAYWVAQVVANNSFRGDPLVLEGKIAGSLNGSSQYLVYSPNEWAFGQGVPTGKSTEWNPPLPLPWWDNPPPIYF